MSFAAADPRRRGGKKKKKRAPPTDRIAITEDGDLAGSSSAGASNLLVAVRVRPISDSEVARSGREVARVMASKVVVLMDPSNEEDVLRKNRSREKRYGFDAAFGPEASQEDVYEATCRPLLEGVLDGFNATVFAYGPTGAGKTYTMLGTYSERGVMHRTLVDLFHLMEPRKVDIEFRVTISYLEIYNECLRDLLIEDSPDLELREDSNGAAVVCGVRQIEIDSPDEMMRLLNSGNRRRTQEATGANATSSRSHAVLEVRIEQTSNVPGRTTQIQTSKLYLIDLAGSERAANTKNTGQRMVEGQHINRSLLALGNCINSLGGPQKHKYVNYRDSKLTRLLKDSLGGNCRTVMIAHISPASLHFEESYNTLNYANRAKNIKTKVVRNVHNVQAHISEYEKIIENLRSQILGLKEQLRSPARPSTAGDGSGAASGHDRKVFTDLRERILTSFDAQMQIQRELLQIQERETELSTEITDAQYTLDTCDDDSTEEMKTLRLELATMESEQAELADMKEPLISKLSEQAMASDDLAEDLPRRIASEERLEILQQLFELHTLELKNMELTYKGKVNMGVFLEKDKVIERLLRQQQLRDQIIDEQRALLAQRDIAPTSSLEVLYEKLARLRQQEQQITAKDKYTLDRRRTSFSMTSTGPVPVQGGKSRHKAPAAPLPPITSRAARKSVQLAKLNQRMEAEPSASSFSSDSVPTSSASASASASVSSPPPRIAAALRALPSDANPGDTYVKDGGASPDRASTFQEGTQCPPADGSTAVLRQNTEPADSSASAAIRKAQVLKKANKRAGERHRGLPSTQKPVAAAAVHPRSIAPALNLHLSGSPYAVQPRRARGMRAA